VSFKIFRVFCTPNRTLLEPQTNPSSERSAAADQSHKNGLWRRVEEPVPTVAEGTPATLLAGHPRPALADLQSPYHSPNISR
jgi:hypothetical protein